MGIISVLSDRKNKITKEIINKDLDKGALGHIVRGTGQAFDVNAEGLYDIIRHLRVRSCLCNGMVLEEGLDKYKVGKPGVTRSNKHYDFPAGVPAWIVLDCDFYSTYWSPEQMLEQLAKYDPAIAECAKVVSYSSSSFLYSSETGEKLNKRDNYHIYLEIEDGDHIRPYCEMLHERLILDGFGSIMVFQNVGRMKVRSLIDRAVWVSGQSREIFEFPPVCCDGVESRKLDEMMYEDGPMLEWNEGLMLSGEEEIRLALLIDELKNDPATVREAAQQRKIWKLNRLKNKKKNRTGKTVIDEDEWEDSRGVLHTILGTSEYIKSNNGDDIRVLTIAQNPYEWAGKGLPDPADPWKRGIEGQQVGTDIARVRWDEETGRVFIYSFYGDVEYDLAWDFDSIVELVNECESAEEVDGLLDEVLDPTAGIKVHLSDGETETLATIIAEKCKEDTKGGKKSQVGTDLRKAPKKFAAIVEKAPKVETSVTVTTNSLGAGTPKSGGLLGKTKIKLPTYIAKDNSKMGMAMVGGKARVITETYNKDLKEWTTDFTAINQLKEFRINERVQITVKGESVWIPRMEAWHEHPLRNTYDRIIFEPRNDVFRGCGCAPIIQQGGEYNQWMGFLANLDNAKKCDRILAHIRDVWCSGKEVAYEYALAWLAELFQNPGGVGQTYLVLKSAQGAGKNIIIDNVLGRLLGVHAITTGDKNDVIGRFNSHLGLNVLLFMDEALFAGDPVSKNLMKSLINPSRMVERKGIDKTKGRNTTKLIIATNEEHAVNIEYGDRRHAYLPVSNHRKGDTQYFKELIMEIENGGREGFLKFLLEHKGDINLSTIPDDMSPQRAKDQRRSASPPLQFIMDLFENGVEQYDYSKGDRTYSDVEFEGWEDKDIMVPKPVFLQLFRIYCQQSNIKAQHTDTRAFFSALTHEDKGYYAPIKVKAAEGELAWLREKGRDKFIRIKARKTWLDAVEKGMISGVD